MTQSPHHGSEISAYSFCLTMAIPKAAARLLYRRITAECLSRRHLSQQVVPFMEPLHIIGGGSIGLLFAGSIRKAFPSYPVSLLLRDHHRPRIDEDDNEVMICLMQDGRPRMVSVPAQIISDNRPRPIQTLVVTTKAYAAVDAVRSVLHRLNSDGSCSIVVLCNGALAVKDDLIKLLSDANQQATLFLATTTHGAYQENNTSDSGGLDEMYHVVHAGHGLTFIENHPSLSALWDQSGLSCQSVSHDDMMIMLWQKLAANCAINPLTALLNCENGELLDIPTSKDLGSCTIDNIVKEVSLIATASAAAESSDGSNLHFDIESLRSFVQKVIQDTYHNKSSMLQDVTKKQKTEVEYLNGYVIKKGRELGIDTPVNEEVCNRIRELSKDYS